MSPRNLFHFSLLFSLLALPFTGWTQNVDTVGFEKDHPRVEIDSSGQSLWQRAVPQKNVFTGAYEGSKVVLTDSVNSYPANNLSRFTLGFDLYGSQPSVSFKHRWDTDSLHDGGFIEISNDSGNSWTLLSNTSFKDWRNGYRGGQYGLQTQNFYGPQDSLANGSMGFSGRSGNWISSRIIFPCYAIKKPFQFQLRFNFYSDSMAEARDGWMIDEVVINNSGGCSSIAENASLLRLTVYPQPADNQIEVRLPQSLKGQETVCKLYNIRGELIRQQDVAPGAHPQLDMKKQEPGIYTLMLYQSRMPVGWAKVVLAQ